MSVGGRLLAACCANGGLSNNQIPTCPFTTITIQVDETNTFVTGSLLYPATVVKHNYPYADLNEHVWNYAYKDIDTNPNSAERYNLLNFGTINGTWTVTSNAIETETLFRGPIVRPGTSIVIVTAPYKVRRYTFTRNSCTVVHASGLSNYISNTHDDILCACNSCATPVSDVGIERGATQTLLNRGPTTITLLWIGACSRPVAGMTLFLKPAGLAVGPWTIESNGTSVILKNGSGTTFTYNGTISSAVASINSAGFFTASVATSTANALTSDLKVSKSNPITTNCVYEGLLIAVPGDEIAPGVPSPAVGYQGTATLSVPTNLGYFLSSTSGFPSTAIGATQYFTQGFYAKGTGSYPGWGEIRSDNISATLGPFNWSLTSGASVITRTYTIGTNTFTTVDETTIICFGCYADPFDPPQCGTGNFWSPCFSTPFYWAFNPFSTCVLGGPPGGWQNVCTGSPVDLCPGLTSPGSFWVHTSSSTPIASTSPVTARWEVSGRFYLS